MDKSLNKLRNSNDRCAHRHKVAYEVVRGIIMRDCRNNNNTAFSMWEKDSNQKEQQIQRCQKIKITGQCI